MKSIREMTAQASRYLGDAFMRIFSPNRDEYPKTGTRPFTGDTAKSTN